MRWSRVHKPNNWCHSYKLMFENPLTRLLYFCSIAILNICMQKHDDTIRGVTQFFRKIYLSLYLKGFERVTQGFTVRGSWRPNRTVPYWPPTLLAITVFLYLLLGCSTGVLGAHSAGCWFCLPHLLSNWLNFLCTELYNSSTPTFFLWASQIALIQPVYG